MADALSKAEEAANARYGRHLQDRFEDEQLLRDLQTSIRADATGRFGIAVNVRHWWEGAWTAVVELTTVGSPWLVRVYDATEPSVLLRLGGAVHELSTEQAATILHELAAEIAGAVNGRPRP